MLTALPSIKILVTFEGLHGQSLAENVSVQTNDLSELHAQLADQFKIPIENVELFRSGKLVTSMEEIESGYHYRLTFDQDSIIHHLISQLQNDCPKRTLYLLQSKMKSLEFALGFYKNDGFGVLIEKITLFEGNSLAYALGAIVKGLEIGIELDFDRSFIKMVYFALLRQKGLGGCK